MLRIRLCTIIFALFLLSSRAFAHTDLPILHAQNIDELTTRLIQTKSNEERASLLDANKELIIPKLRKRLTAQAVRAVFTGDYETGLNINNLIQLVGERNKDKAWIAVATINSAAVYFLQGKLLDARGAYARVPKIEEISNEKDKDAAAHVLGLRGFIAFFLRSYEQGLKDCRESLKLRDSNEDKLDIGFTFSAMGMILNEQGNYREAREYLQRSLKIFNEIDDKMWRALPLNSLGTLHRLENKPEQAIQYYEESLELIRRFNINILLHYALYGIAESYESLGELEKALEFFRQSLALRQQLTDKAATARALRNIGSIYRRIGDYAQALSHLRQSLQLSEELRSKDLAAARLHDIGIVYYSQNNFSMALEYFERSIKLAEEVNDQETLWTSYSDLGWLHAKLQNYAQSLQYFQKSLMAGEAHSNKKRIILAHETVALAYAWLGEYEKSEPHLQKALALNREIQNLPYLAEVMRYSGQIHFLRKNYNKAVENYLQGLQFAADTNDKHWSLSLLLALVYTCNAKGDHQKTVEYAERATLLARQQNDPETLAEILRLSGKAYRAINQPEKARQAFSAAIQIVEAMRIQVAGDELERQRFFESRISPYHEMVALLLAQNKSAEALIYAERAKARSLLEVLQNGKFDITKTLTGDEQIQERKLNGEILALNSQHLHELQSAKPNQARLEAIKSRLNKARLNYEDFQNRLYVAHPQLKIQRGDAEPFRIEEAAALLPDTKTLLLEYIVTDDRTYLLAIGRSETKNIISIKSFTLPMTGKDLSEKVSRFRRQLAERDFDFTTTAKELYAILIKPALSEIKDKNKLIIVPDAALWEVPFQALISDTNQYLIQSTALAYAPSLTFLRELQKTKNQESNFANASLLAVGNPLLKGQRVTSARRDDKLVPLPESEREVKNLAQLYGTEYSKILVGAEALEDRIKSEASRYNILHFATHGILNDTSPLYSSIVLSLTENDKEDGLLEAWEVMRMDLQAELVVLSACETGRGRIGAGEGLIGFSWALFVAGCPTTVVSQWKVDSASTSELMLEFHKHLKSSAADTKTHLASAEALRQAALRLMQTNEYRHPFYWAGFVVVGRGF
jgi:CHAT domain-containing protein/tetratricopeptide (TPR) repeat protein